MISRACSACPTDPAEAARVAVEGEERLLDVANVEGTPFMGIASFGFDSDAQPHRQRGEAREGQTPSTSTQPCEPSRPGSRRRSR